MLSCKCCFLLIEYLGIKTSGNMLNCQPNVFLLDLNVFNLHLLEWCLLSFGDAHFINKNTKANLYFQKKKKPLELVSAITVKW